MLCNVKLSFIPKILDVVMVVPLQIEFQKGEEKENKNIKGDRRTRTSWRNKSKRENKIKRKIVTLRLVKKLS